jgi:diguanylate cyclase (GGDEF)-like protein
MSKILVVDDIPANIEILKIHLSDVGYDILEASDGPQALDILSEQGDDIDLVLLDVMMPGMSGLEVLKNIRKQSELINTPVILVTANADDQNVAEGLDLGAFDYIIKPYSLMVLLARVRTALREKERLDLLEKWATTDPLTELLNRRFFFELAERETERSLRHNNAISYIMLDIDFFKKVNDEYGHIAGDQTLINLSQLIKQQLRKIDFCCRFGGEEFVICLPDTELEQAREVAERLRLAVEKMPLNCNNKTFNICVSLGIACNKENEQPEQTISRADTALYKAKEAGRNQTQLA